MRVMRAGGGVCDDARMWNVLTVLGLVWGAALGAWLLVGAAGVVRRRSEGLEGLEGPDRPSFCDCGAYALQSQGQQLLDQVDMQVHCGDRCYPYREWLAPGR